METKSTEKKSVQFNCRLSDVELMGLPRGDGPSLRAG